MARKTHTQPAVIIDPQKIASIFHLRQGLAGLSFAQSLRNELKDTGVTVTALQPGPTNTNFFHRAGLDDTKVGSEGKYTKALLLDVYQG